MYGENKFKINKNKLRLEEGQLVKLVGRVKSVSSIKLIEPKKSCLLFLFQ